MESRFDAVHFHSRLRPVGIRRSAFVLYVAALLGVALLVTPAAAQWTRVTAVPVTDVFSVRSVGDTIAAGVDTTVHISTDAGQTWHAASKVAPGAVSIDAVWIRNGRVYAGTFGQGVFVSDDLGVTWQAFNQGLVGGVLDSQLDVADFEVRGDSLFAATFGAGVYVRSLAAADLWHHFGETFEPNQASNVNDLALGGTRLLACAGGNGTTFYRDPGDPEWTISFLRNAGISPGLGALTALWTGTRWVVGSSGGVFLSPEGHEPWTPSSTNLAGLQWSAFAQGGPVLFAAFDFLTGFVFADSHDDGTTWAAIDPFQPGFVFQLAVHGSDLYAARADGLWVRSTATASVAVEGGSRGLRFSLAGPQPVRDAARFRFVLPGAGSASLEVFDITGRRAADRVQGSWSAGPHELTFDTRGLPPGVYAARLTSGGIRETARLVRVR